jgi:hypothetical protein
VRPQAITGKPISAYPNPFTHSATIGFSLEQSGFIELSIFNLLGTEILTIFRGQLDQGKHSFTWNAQDAEQGTYICIVRSKEGLMEIPIVLIK